MIPKFRFHILGWITLVIFPIPAFWALNYFEDISFIEVLSFDDFFKPINLIGLQFGLFYALIVVAVSQFSIFQEMSIQQERLLRSLNLNWFDIIFMSLCAGIGEEILFRAGIQTWLGPWWTSILFIALHGYIHPLSWRKSVYGLILLPFILLISFAYETYGLWFCVAAHFSYDLLLFSLILNKKKSSVNKF